MRVHVVDPPAYTPPYDHALCAALARAGADVTLVTTRFAYGAVPPPAGYAVRHAFYRRGGTRFRRRPRRALRLAQHVRDMRAYARAGDADVVHFQWLPVQELDAWLLPRGRPLVLTAHDVLPREARPGQRAGQRRVYSRVDAVVVHSEHGARRLREEAGVPAEKVHVIPHGPFNHLAALPPAPLPPEVDGDAPFVALCFGLMRPYKGIDVLLEAWRVADVAGELWIAGLPRMDIAPLRAAAPASVRWIPRYLSDAEVAALFRRADLAVLPYRQIDQSGVLYTALAFGTPLLLTAVGGFPEVAGATLVAPGDPAALAHALARLAREPAAPSRPTVSWDEIARRTLALYASLGGG